MNDFTYTFTYIYIYIYIYMLLICSVIRYVAYCIRAWITHISATMVSFINNVMDSPVSPIITNNYGAI